MADNVIALPEGYERLTGEQKQVIHSIREDMAPVLRRMFPRQPDAGKSEFDSLSEKFNYLCAGIDRVLQAKWKKALADHDMASMIELRADVPNAMFQAFRELSKDDLLLLFTTQLSQQWLEHKFPGLPRVAVA